MKKYSFLTCSSLFSSVITSKPVKAIIYNYFHSDHTQGATVMAGDDNPAIYSHEKTLYYLKRIASVTRATTYRRAMRQFGSLLPEGGVLNCGVGPGAGSPKQTSHWNDETKR